MRGLVVLAMALGLLPLAAAPARGSCIQPNLADQIARADVIADGRVTAVDRGAGTLTFRALTVYKGEPGPGKITVQVGPGPRGGGVATSVDYRAEPGDHLLFLQTQGGTYSTNDCSGSHPGRATADELRVLATGTVVTYADPGPDPLDRIGGPAVAFAGLVVLLGIGFAVARRRAMR